MTCQVNKIKPIAAIVTKISAINETINISVKNMLSKGCGSTPNPVVGVSKINSMPSKVVFFITSVMQVLLYAIEHTHRYIPRERFCKYPMLVNEHYQHTYSV